MGSFMCRWRALFLKMVSFVAILGMPSVALAQQTIDIDESTVGSDFNFHECRRQARTLDQSIECTERRAIFEKKFYEDGTLRVDDPTREERGRQDYFDQIRHVFRCTNRGVEVVRLDALFVSQNRNTGEYTIISDSGEVRYSPAPGDLCQAVPPS